MADFIFQAVVSFVVTFVNIIARSIDFSVTTFTVAFVGTNLKLCIDQSVVETVEFF